MLKKLFGSKTRAKLLKLFLSEPYSCFYIREISRKLGMHINSVRRELKNLQKIGLIKGVKPKDLKELNIEEKQKQKRKYYKTNRDFVLYPELKALFIKSQLLLRNSLIRKIQKIGKVDLLILTGLFTGIKNVKTDILIIGRVNRRKMKTLIKRFEKDLDREIYYTIMTKQEFKNRKDLTDRFLFDILENRKIVILNNLKVS